jgi:hypothetical protein
MLSTPKYSAFSSYLTGWLGTVGNWTCVSAPRDLDLNELSLIAHSVTASITFGGSQLILAAATLYHDDYVPTAWQTVLVYWAALLGSLLINIFFNK